VLAGLYSEPGRPGAPPDDARADAPSFVAAPSTAGFAADRAKTPADTNPAIMAMFNELRSSRHAGAGPAGRQGAEPRRQSLGARPPLPPMQDEDAGRPPEKVDTSYISTLAKPVQKPVSGKRTVLPRASTGRRMPTGQPANRNLPFSQQAIQHAQAQNPLQDAPPAQAAAGTSIPGPASIGQNSPGVDALNAFAAQHKAAPPLAPATSLPGMTAADKAKNGG
jgi:hypothetical protein